MTQFTIKNLDFIDDKNLQLILKERLDELDKVFSSNANLSSIILSISSIEGIFTHFANIFKIQIKGSPKYPKRKDGRKKDFDKLTIEEIYKLLLEQDILKEIKNFDSIYELFRNYRNFIHPQKQLKESWPVGLGQSQIAIGLLNATIDQTSKCVFLGTEIFERISGRPRYDPSKVLHLDLANVRTHSFMVLKRKIDKTLKIRFKIDLGENGVFNFVFNYFDEGNFKMLRLDNRNSEGTPNALLYCKQPFYWEIEAEASDKQPPEGELSIEIFINYSTKIFSFKINGKAYRFFKRSNEIKLFNELKPSIRIGWFNEVSPVKLWNIKTN